MIISNKGLSQIRILKLVDGEVNDGVLHRLQKGWIIHFVLGPTLSSKTVSIYTNIPNEGEEYNRSKYHQLKWESVSKSSNDKLDAFAAVLMHSAGSFQYYFSYNGKVSGSGYLIVDPTLRIGQNNSILPLDSVCVHTVLTKLLGTFSTWKKRLLTSKECGYNLIHFTPIQELGISNSSYSLADQLSLNPIFSQNEKKKITFEDVKELVSEMQQNWSILSATDVVWNHTAKNSKWLMSNPDCAYNLENSPYLRPAYLLDRAVFHLSLDICHGKYDSLFPDRKILNFKDLKNLQNILEATVIPSLKLHEFFQVNIDNEVKKFEKALHSKQTFNCSSSATISIIQNRKYIRFGCTIDMEIAVKQFGTANNLNATESVQSFKDTIEWLNQTQKESVENDMKAAVSNIIATVTYERLSNEGPKLTKVDGNHPLVTCYFNHPFPNTKTSDEEKNVMNDNLNSRLIMAYNGWVMGADALKNFADSPGMVYFRRELICWGDSVKLRYGSKPSDCPVLWDRMKKYTEKMAEIFHGLRIDNCHSTPIHVAEYLLDAARKVRPDLYVFAELFTGSEYIDNIFVNRLGLTSLIREALNSWDSHELGRLVYMYGGEPIASFKQPCLQDLKPSRAHALFYDMTHDNDSMIIKQCLHGVVPSSALVAMSSCAIGSSRGHDELTPHHIHVVNENRLFRKWSCNNEPFGVGSSSGIIRLKYLLNSLHQTLAKQGFNQVFVDQRSPHVVAVTRHNPETHQSYILVAHTSFTDLLESTAPPFTVEGCVVEIAIESKPKQQRKSTADFLKTFVKDNQYINGVDDYYLTISTDLLPEKSSSCEITPICDCQKHVVVFTDFPPGSILVLNVEMTQSSVLALKKIQNSINILSSSSQSEFDSIVSSLSLQTLNRVLFRCDEEEKSDGLDIGVYEVPNFGKFSYCGIAGVAVHMAKIKSNNDLGHPICSNLREGNWLLDYISSRLEKHQETLLIGKWYSECFKDLKNLPRFLIPTYFEMIISLTFKKLKKACWSQMSSFIRNGTHFIKQLSLGTVALCGSVKGASLPSVFSDASNLLSIHPTLSMAAGLPHFSFGVMRCWGRDTFIAMHGLQLVTGQLKDARNTILAFASCLRHGLIPNLLGEGKIPRYNCRDAVWFWLQCIQDLCEFDSYDVLQHPVSRLFPSDDSEAGCGNIVTQPLHEVVQEALQRHVDGIKFYERNAGPKIDMNMSDKGFHVEAGIRIDTGFVYGGNDYNCGTWMDKMGESEKSGTKGIPATPRDGSAVELVGLCKSTVSWLEMAYKCGKYPYAGVTVKNETLANSLLTWSVWSEKIATNFEKCFFVSESDNSHLVHKRFIYKDSFGASKSWCDYQLRPNFPIAMVYAPELFDPNKAWKALEIVQKKLLGPLGIKTLDPDDMQYRGDYENSNDSNDASVAKGFNYHQGPEWLWPVGYFLRAKLHFAVKLGPDIVKETIKFIQSYIVRHHLYLDESSWCGLPELTNNNGSFCQDSCPIQAWSHATLLDLMYDLSKIEV